MNPLDPSAEVVRRRMLSHSKPCESCKRIPQLARELSWENEECESIHHATAASLESAADKGCKLCRSLWRACSQRLMAAQHTVLNLWEDQAFCSISIFQLSPEEYDLIYEFKPSNCVSFTDRYIMRQIAGKLYSIPHFWTTTISTVRSTITSTGRQLRRQHIICCVLGFGETLASELRSQTRTILLTRQRTSLRTDEAYQDLPKRG